MFVVLVVCNYVRVAKNQYPWHFAFDVDANSNVSE